MRLAAPFPRSLPVLLPAIVAAILAAAALAIVLGYVTRHDVAELGARYQIIDDAYYYLEIADNLRRGCGASFDCRHPTNGYHPLWLLLLTGLSALHPSQGDGQVWLMQGLGIALFLAAAVLTTLLARRMMPEARVAPFVPAALLAANPSLFYVAINGLETPAAFLALALLAFACHAALLPPSGVHPSWRAALAVAAAGGLAFLARLDYAIVAAGALGALLLADIARTRRPAARSVVAVALVGLVVGAYLMLNLALFDAALPVSGSIKQTPFLDRLTLGALYGPAGAVSALLWPLRFVTWPGNPWLLAFAGALTLGAVAAIWHGSPARLRDLFLLLSGWVHAALYLLLQSSGPEYYFLPLILSVAWSVAVLVRWAERRLRALSVAGVAVALAVLAIAGPLAADRVLERDRPLVPWRLDRLRAVAWMNEALPPGSVVGSWWSGAIGYYSRHTVINLDGLVNSRDFVELLRHCRLADYLRDNGVTHLADYLSFAMIEQGVPDETTFPGRCWGELWAGLAAAGQRLEPVRLSPDPERPSERAFAVLALRRD